MKSEKSATEGMLVPCMMAGSDEWSTAEIIKIRSTPADATSPSTTTAATEGDGDGVDSSSSGASSDVKKLYYVHYVDFNKRLDCWVTEDRLDFSQARLKGQEAVEKETGKRCKWPMLQSHAVRHQGRLQFGNTSSRRFLISRRHSFAETPQEATGRTGAVDVGRRHFRR